MRKTLINGILIITAIFILSAGYSQQFIPKKCYFHFAGHIGDKFTVTLNLIKINDSLYGDYDYRLKSSGAPDGSMENISSDVLPVICGRMKPDGTFNLNVPFSKGTPMVSGQFLTNQIIAGTWQTHDGKFSFEMSDKFTDGTVQFNVSYLKAVIPLANKKGAPRGKMELAMLSPSESSNPVISDTLRNIMLEKFTRKTVEKTNPDTNLFLMKKAFAENYVSSNEELYRSPAGGQSMNWESLEFMHILYNDRHFLSFYTINYGFTGGAHGLEVVEFYVINLRTGKILEFSDLFRDDFQNDLTSLLTRAFKKKNSLQPGQKLTDAGYFVDEVKPVNNFYVTGDGIGFFYNHYEIAPYSNGPSNCFLRFDELESLLKPGSSDGLINN